MMIMPSYSVKKCIHQLINGNFFVLQEAPQLISNCEEYPQSSAVPLGWDPSTAGLNILSVLGTGAHHTLWHQEALAFPHEYMPP